MGYAIPVNFPFHLCTNTDPLTFNSRLKGRKGDYMLLLKLRNYILVCKWFEIVFLHKPFVLKNRNNGLYCLCGIFLF